jgi:ribosomal protein S18 acetylase RimI-like enzyme
MPLVRHAEVEEAEIVHELIQAAFAEYRDTLPVPPGALSETLEETRERVAQGRTLLLLTSEDVPALSSLVERMRQGEFKGKMKRLRSIFDSIDTPIATASYEPRDGYLYIGRLAVHPGFRRRSAGRLAIEEIEGIAPELGCKRVRLGTRESMPSNIAFYTSLGYSLVEREPHKRGPDTILWFEKELTDVKTPADLVEERVELLKDMPGRRLTQVTYEHWHSGDGEPVIDKPLLILDGEIELLFEDGRALYVSTLRLRWGPAPIESCINLTTESALTLEGYRAFDAGETSLWSPFIGEIVEAVALLGNEYGTPFVLKLSFSSGNIYVGSGHAGRGYFFGRDDLFVRSEEEFQAQPAHQHLRLLWERRAEPEEEG